MKNNKFIKLIALVSVIVLVFASCSSQSGTDNGVNSAARPEDGIKNPVTTPNLEDNHIKPDLSKVEVPKPSENVTKTDTVENFVTALQSFANPYGNEYDALSILGEFRYDEKGDELLERLKTAADSWHDVIEKSVGRKCVVKFKLNEVTKYDMTDEAVSDWNFVNGLEAEDFAKISCTISTNYARKSITYIFDIVKIDGKWHLSTIGTINKIQSLITIDIYR